MSNETVVFSDQCDESKCVSYSSPNGNTLSYSCYSNSNWFPMACADGYTPRIVDSEPVIRHKSEKRGTYVVNDVSYVYFTCCPPDLPSKVNVTRHCSNPTTIFNQETVRDNNNNITIPCKDKIRPYPRQMASWGKKESFLCCDSIIEYAANYLNNTDCVPFVDKKFLPSKAINSYGNIQTVSCNNQGIYNNFRFPQIIDKNSSYGIHFFECCKTGTTLPPFVEDHKFKISVYPQIVVSSLAVSSCTLLILALLIPLFLHLKKRSERASSTDSNTRINISAPHTTSTSKSRNRSRTHRQLLVPPYNSYVLYLVYLALPDLMLNMYFVIMYSRYANQIYNPHIINGAIFYDGSKPIRPFEGSFVVACSTANLYLNCVVSFQILTLLRDSYNVERHNPPSLLKVTLQSVVVYLFSILVFLTHYFIGRAQQESFDIGDSMRSQYLTSVNLYWSIVVSYISPTIFFGYVWFSIWYRGYMKSAAGKMKQLAWYFFRIFVIFNVIWLPGMFFITIGAAFGIFYGNYNSIGYLFCSIQPIVSTCMTMMKSDVRKLTLDFITLSYIRKTSE